MAAILLFILQNVFLTGALFLNRQYKREIVQRKYLVSFMVGSEENKYTFMLYELPSKQYLMDRKLQDKLYKPGLKTFDTLILKFEKGLFGIEFPGNFLSSKQ
jgi:hypothetical protein